MAPIHSGARYHEVQWPKGQAIPQGGICDDAKGAQVHGPQAAPPGQHGASKKRAKLSDYAKQLMEKQRLRLQYNLHERQMTNYIKKASRIQGNKVDIFVQLLEQRLDALVFRSGLARSIYAARQYVRHGHVTINGKRSICRHIRFSQMT
ncbi:MAG: 30S ribosomal protein S4 [Ignavibacteria bacterium]|nr:30S ribosomal protein S4 [Ignavibacteria bacterium]